MASKEYKRNPDRREALRMLGLGGAAMFYPGCGGSPGSKRSTGNEGSRVQGNQGRPPNIVFILVDDWGWRDAGFMGSRFYETPHIDRLAREGMVFTNAYANAPNCAPTRACLMSGQYTPRHGVYTVGRSERGKGYQRKLVPIANRKELAGEVVTIAEALRGAGYVSASMGKWHLGNDPELGPLGQGFDVNMGGTQAGSPRSYFSPYKNAKLADGPAGEYLTDRLTTEALAFIDEHQDRPFFLYLPHYAVHTPLQAKAAKIAKYEKKTGTKEHHHPTYAAMIESTDEGVGRILDRLDELGLADDTVVVLFSDNGGYGPATSMAPLRGAKGMIYEGGIRVPLVVRWPGRAAAGSRCETPVIGIDFYPTLLEITGAAAATGQALDGESLVPLLRQRGGFDREAIYWHFPAYLERYRGGYSSGLWRTTPVSAVRAGDWKLMEFFEDGRLELYHLKEDIGEQVNLAEERPEKRDALYRLLKAWRRAVKAPVPTQLNPHYNPEKIKLDLQALKKRNETIQTR